MAQTELLDRDRIPIANLGPSNQAESSTIVGVVALIWPYSSSGKTFAVLLVEPDFRLRRTKGQVLVRFYGSSAKAIAKSGVSSGDQILLSLTGALWVEDDSTTKTPGKGIEWELHFRERVVLQVFGTRYCNMTY